MKAVISASLVACLLAAFVTPDPSRVDANATSGLKKVAGKRKTMVLNWEEHGDKLMRDRKATIDSSHHIALQTPRGPPAPYT